jgi:hypothetical protein
MPDSVDRHQSSPALPRACAPPALADARRDLAGPPRCAGVSHSQADGSRLAQALGSPRCSRSAPGSQVDRRGTASRIGGSSTRRPRARPFIAERRKLDSGFRGEHSTHVLVVRPPAVHEGPGANLDPPSFCPPLGPTRTSRAARLSRTIRPSASALPPCEPIGTISSCALGSQ